MKKIGLTLGLFMMIALSVMAQRRGGERPNAEERAQRMTERMAEELGLDEEQKAKILAINLEAAQARDAQMEAAKEAREAMKKQRESMREEMKAQDERIKAVLTEEQAAKWEETKREKREDLEKRRRKGPRTRDGEG